MMNYVIVGNGIVGLSTAFQLAKRASVSDSIVIIGPMERVGSATEAAGAMLNSFAEIEAGGLDHEVDVFRFELSRQATRLWPTFADCIIETARAWKPDSRLAIGFDSGTYIINNASADNLDDDNFDAIKAALLEFDKPFVDIHPSDIPNYDPEQRSRATRALLIPGEGWINPRLIMDEIQRALRSFSQVLFVDGSVRNLVHENGCLTGVVLADESVIEGDEYLLATGASVTSMLQSSNLSIGVQPIFHGVGTSVEIISEQAQHKCIRTPNRGLACGIYSIPYFQGTGQSNDHILIGATNRISPTPVYFTNLSSVESLTKAAMEQINRNYYRAELFRINVGWRPTSQDGYPLIGRSSVSNLTIVTGTKRDGFHLAPVFSEITADFMQRKNVDERMDVFHPERKPLRTLSRGQAVEKAVRHTLSAWYQHGYSPAKSRMPEMVAASVRSEAERLHDQVGAVDWGIPPEMHDMYRYGHAKA